MSKIQIFKRGITNFDVDCIVNAANSSLAYGGGVCGAFLRLLELMNYQRLVIELVIVILVML